MMAEMLALHYYINGFMPDRRISICFVFSVNYNWLVLSLSSIASRRGVEKEVWVLSVICY